MIGPSKVLSFDPGFGVFAWFATPSTAIYMLLVVSPIAGIVNNVSFFAAYHYWPMQIIAGTILLQPYISQVVGVLLGQDEIPGFRTGFGLAVIAVGISIASYGTKIKTTEEADSILRDDNVPETIQLSLIEGMRSEHSERARA